VAIELGKNMEINEIEKLLKKFRWNTLQSMYGCAHSSIIGFISTEWINLSPEEHSVLDGAPSPKRGKGRRGQKNADILLCKGDNPLIPVEVETSVSKYEEKLQSLFDYLNNTTDFNGAEFGLLFMTNLCKGEMKYKHNWDKVKDRVKEEKESTIAFVSINKEKNYLGKDSPLNILRKRNDYYPWGVVIIDYWIYNANQEREGNLWKK